MVMYDVFTLDRPRLELELGLGLGLGLDYGTLGLSNPRINEPSDCRPVTIISAPTITKISLLETQPNLD